MEITSLENKKVKEWTKLKLKKYRDLERLFLVEDEHLVSIGMELGIVKEVITLEDKEYNIPTYKVTEGIMNKISSQDSGAKIIAVCKFLEEKDINGNVIILDNIQDPGNLGTIIRSAVAFNFNTIILSNDSVDLYNPKVVRASEGMIFNINVIRRDITEVINDIKDSYLVVTTSVNNGVDIREIKYDKIAIVIGNEGNGVSKRVSDLCNSSVYIKMNNACESLNAGVSASILMYEVYHG